MKCSRSLHRSLILHMDHWNSCSACDLHQGRSQVLYYVGEIPCKVLYVGTGPDMIANITNSPHCDSTMAACWPSVSWAATYLLGCGPVSDETATPEEKMACQPKFLEFLTLASPRFLVGIGKAAETFMVMNIKTISTILGHRPIVSSIPSPVWMSKQKDKDLVTAKAKLHVEDLVRKYPT